MRIVGIAFLILLLAAQLRAQIPTSSPALDPDFIVLQPKEEYTGRYANQSVGSVIHTVAPLNWKVPQGVVFLGNVDTAGYTPTQIERSHPGGPFKQDPNFSLFNRALFKKSGLRDPVMVFSHGKNEYPIMVAKGFEYGVATPILFFFFPDSSGVYTDSAYAYTRKAFILGGYGNSTGWAKVDIDNDGFEDLFTAEEDAYDGDSTSIGLWYSYDIIYKGDTLKDGTPILKPSQEWVVPNRMRGYLEAQDFDHDGAVDLCYNTEHRILTIIFGKLVASKWDIDTIISVQDSAIRSFLFMDFLHEDGIADLIIGTDDTIYCFDGSRPNFLRNGFRLDETDLKIPSPAKLDPKNFQGNGHGALYEWGWWMFNAGNVNGSGKHSLATLCYLSPDTANLGGPAYCFIYSGGKAADEKADAIFADNSSLYVIFLNLDTVQTSDGSISDILLGDPYFNAGRTGKIYYFKGRKDIPHKPDPRWLSVSEERVDSDIKLKLSYSKNGLHITINSKGTSAGRVTLLDMLGRVVFQQSVPYGGSDERTMSISTSKLSQGVYIITYEQGNTVVSQKVCVMEYGEAGTHRFLPEQWHACPFVPEYAFTIADEYLSRWVSTTTRYKASR
jgi:hypothetical protein